MTNGGGADRSRVGTDSETKYSAVERRGRKDWSEGETSAFLLPVCLDKWEKDPDRV